jgi:hypothetical protein
MSNISIQKMSDAETPFRIYLKSQNFLRNACVPMKEQIDKIRPYMGNPFIQPGTLGGKS